MSPKFLVSITVLLVIAACAPAVPGPIPTTSAVPPGEIPEFIPTVTPPAATSTVLDQMVDVGGYQRIICTGEGTPTVVVETAPGEPSLETGLWLRVRYGVEKTTRICLYDRAGLGSSDAPPAKPRTSQHLTDDLHTLLVKGGVHGPYVLVGWDYGALNVRLYASQYPDEVVGMVLVDPLHPDYESATLAVLPAESPGETAILGYMRQGLWPDPLSGEGLDLAASAEQVRASGSLGDLPLVVLTRRTLWFFQFPDLPADVTARMEQVWRELQADLAKLSSNSTHIITLPDGQNAPVDEEQQVIDAILQVVDQAKR